MMIKSMACIVLFSFGLVAVEIRQPHPSEIKDIAQLYYDAWHNTYDSIAPHLSAVRTRQNCLKQWQQYHLKGNRSFILIALHNKKIVGVVFAGPLENKSPKICASYDSEIDKLYIAPALKNQGIGSQLLQACFAKLQSLGFQTTIVRCLTKNKNSNAFYEKRGGVLIAQSTVAFNETMNIYAFKTVYHHPCSE